MPQEKILVVEDNPDIVEMLVFHILAPLNFEIMVAHNGMEGLEKAIKEKPDLILLDLNMPYMNGFEMLRAMQSASQDFPVIVMTAAGSETIAVSAFRLGVRDYLTKPFSPEEVRQAIDRALLEKRIKREFMQANKDLIKAEAIRQTVTTLSHHINNHIQVIDAGLALLNESLLYDSPPVETQTILRDGRKSVQHIKAVMRVLRNITKVQISRYSRTTPMIDVDKIICSELDKNAAEGP